MKLVTTVAEILGAALNDPTPKARHQFFKADGATCLFGGIIKQFGVVVPDSNSDDSNSDDSYHRRNRILDGFIQMGDVEIDPAKIGNTEMRDFVQSRYPRGTVPVGEAAMSLNDASGHNFGKQEIAAALLDAMTPEQIKTLLEIELT